MIDILASNTFEESCYEDPWRNIWPIFVRTLTLKVYRRGQRIVKFCSHYRHQPMETQHRTLVIANIHSCSINQIPSYAKFLKDLTTVKKKKSICREVAFATQASCLIQQPIAPKYEDLGSLTISVRIGEQIMDKCLLDLWASVNFLPYSVYKQLGLGELQPTNLTLLLADRLVKVPKGIVEDAILKVDKFFSLRTLWF